MLQKTCLSYIDTVSAQSIPNKLLTRGGYITLINACESVILPIPLGTYGWMIELGRIDISIQVSGLVRVRDPNPN